MVDAPWPAAKYRLLDRAYMGMFPGDEPRIVEAGAEVIWDGKPGPHMEALDDDGRAAKERAGFQRLDFTSVAPMTVGDEQDVLVERAAAAASAGVIAALTQAGLLGGGGPQLPPDVGKHVAVMQTTVVPAATITAPPAPPLPPKAPKAA